MVPFQQQCSATRLGCHTNHIGDQIHRGSSTFFYLWQGIFDCRLGQRPNCNQTPWDEVLFCAYVDFNISVISNRVSQDFMFGMMSPASCIN
jgi:hypothetical protein